MSLQGEAQSPKKGPTKLLVPLVIAIGVFLGVTLAYLVPLPFGYGPFGPPIDELRNLLIVHSILSMVVICLQVALIIVYLKVYSQTGANFALGILIMMLALLLQSLLNSPIILGFVGRYSEEFGPYLSSGDIFTIAAYSIFLYLSLE
jgi:hypothetical protein